MPPQDGWLFFRLKTGGQPIDAVSINTTQSTNPTTEYLQRIRKLYGPSADPGSGGGLFDILSENHPQSRIASYLGMLMSGGVLGSNNGIHNTESFNGTFDNVNSLDTTEGSALRDHNDFNGVFNGDVNSQIEQQKYVSAQRRVRDEAESAQAVAEAQKLALEPRPNLVMDETAFGQSRIRESVLNKGTKPQQPLKVMKAIAQHAQSRAATLRRVQMPKRPGAQ